MIIVTAIMVRLHASGVTARLLMSIIDEGIAISSTHLLEQNLTLILNLECKNVTEFQRG